MHYFISDLHLDESRPDITAALFRFIDCIQGQASKLYILGDLFEAWLGDDDDTPVYQEVMHRLALLTSKHGVELLVMHGNRDFLLGDRFCTLTGAILLEDSTTVTLGNTPYILTHGDRLCIDDHEYMAFRAMVRTPQWQEAMLAKPLAERKAYARSMRAQSKDANRQKAQDIMDVNQRAVIELMEEQQAHHLLHGHTHRPFDHSFEHKQNMCRRLVLGDWDTLGWHAKFDGQSLDLYHWPLDSKSPLNSACRQSNS